MLKLFIETMEKIHIKSYVSKDLGNFFYFQTFHGRKSRHRRPSETLSATIDFIEILRYTKSYYFYFTIDTMSDDVCVSCAQNVSIKFSRSAPRFVIARRINSSWRMVSENNLSKSRTAVKIAVNSKPFADA